jgi:hypothetical protein
MKVNYQTQNQLMKKVSFIIFSVFILSASRIQAQGIHIGIKAGVNLGQVNGRSFDDGYKVGFSAGGFAELNFTSKWGIKPEVLFNQTNTTTVNSFNEIIPQGINNQSTKLNYLSIPILLSYKPIPLLSFQLGPQFGILMNSSQTIVGNGKNAFKTGDFAMVGGAQLNVGGFKAGARYAIGLTNINDINDQDSWKNQSVQLYVGLRIF